MRTVKATVVTFGFALLLIMASLLLVAPAGADTYNFSTLNGLLTSGRGAHVPTCPCTINPLIDPINGGLQIFAANGGQTNGWIDPSGNATLYFAGDGRGNNAGKVYVLSGGPGFTVPGGNTNIGLNNTQFTGDYALSNGFPCYFWCGSPGSTSVTPATGSPVYLNGFDISGIPAVPRQQLRDRL